MTFHRFFAFVLSICLLTGGSSPTVAQNDWDLTYSISAELGFNSKSKGFFNLSLAMGIKRYVLGGDHDWNHDETEHVVSEMGRHFFLAYQPTINIYGNGLGDNILDGYKRVEVDFINALMINIGQPNNGLQISNQLITPFNSFSSNAVYDDFTNSLALGTCFVFNNHNRNQIIGFFNVNIARVVRIGYYNDGVPFGGFGLADRFDRWWTGGGYMEVYFNQGFGNEDSYLANTLISYQFDRFTGDVQDAFRVAKIFNFRHVPDHDVVEAYYNNSRSKVAIRSLRDGLELSYQWLGDFHGNIQDLIHKTMNIPYHTTYAPSYRVFGVKYQYTQTFQP